MSLEVVTPGYIRTARSDAAAAAVDVRPSDTEILELLVAEGGSAHRVAGKLGLNLTEVYAVVTRNPRMLSTKLRSRLMLDTFMTLVKVQAVLIDALAEMPADAVGRTYAATIAAFSNLAGQFEETEAVDTDDDATNAKEFILARIQSMKKREVAEGEQVAT